MPVVKGDGTVVLALVRGDDRLSESKLLGVLGSDFRPATTEEIRAAFGADPGSLGPIGFAGEVVADDALHDGQYVAGANRTGWHLRGVEAGRDFEPRFADIREPVEGDGCPHCSGRLGFQTAIEVGHIFKFGTRYSEPLDATFLDEDGTEKPLVGGSYGIGPGRVLAAAVEQLNDERGSSGRRRSPPTTSRRLARRRQRGDRDDRGRGRGDPRCRGPRRPARRPRPPAGREVRRRRPDRLSLAGDRRQEDARRRVVDVRARGDAADRRVSQSDIWQITN